MPVQMITISSSNIDFLKKTGVPAYLIEQLKLDGVKLKLGVNTVAYFYDDFLIGKTTLPVKIDSALKGLAGSVDVADLLSKAISDNILPKVKMLKAGVSKEDVAKAVQCEVEKDEAAAKPPVTFNGPSFKPQPKPKPVVFGPVELAHATQMYQRVKGTTNTDYYVVAIHPSVKIAVRLSGHSVSIRAEGDLSDEAIALALVKAGLKLKNTGGGNYASEHFKCNTEATPAHLIGAVLCATDLEFQTPFPSIKALKKITGDE